MILTTISGLSDAYTRIEARVVAIARRFDLLSEEVEDFSVLAGAAAMYCTGLTALVGTVDRARVYCDGYTTAVDGGGGEFVWYLGSTTAADGGTVFGAGTGRWKRVFSGAVSPRWFGAKGDASTNDTAAMQVCFATAYKTFDLEGRTYSVTIPYAGYLAKWTSQTDITIRNGTIVDTTVHTISHGTYTKCFWFDGCTNIRVLDVNYTGGAIATPATYLGYRGCSFVYLTTQTTDVVVEGRVRHAAHGVVTGNYTEVGLNGCSNIRAKLDTYFVGYPWASSNSDNIDLDLTTDTSHRTAYIAGTNGGKVVARFKNQYVAPVQVLLTEAITPSSTYVGCRNITVDATDIGSTTFIADSWCVGISVQRLQVVTFENIDIHVSVRGTDTIASTLGALTFANNGASYWSASSVIRNITLRGSVDRSAQTITDHASGDVYLRPVNVDTVSPICENIVLDGFSMRKGSATPQSQLFQMPLLAGGGLSFRNCDLGDYNVILVLNTSAPTRWSGTKLKGFATFSAAYPQTMAGCTVTTTLPASVLTSTKLDSCSVNATVVLHNVATAITASTTQTQGQMPLIAVVNDVTVCANANDTVTLPSAAPEHPQLWALNNGANTLKIYPASGDDLGAGVDTSVTLAAGAKASWAAINNTTWRRLV